MGMAETIRMLATHSLFRGLGAQALIAIANQVTHHNYQRGEMIVWQGEPSMSVYLIMRGIAAVTRIVTADGKKINLAYLMPGQSFGEIGVLADQPRSASIAALTDVDVLSLQRRDFQNLLYQHPSVAIALAQALGQHLIEADRRHAQEGTQSRLILLFDLGVGAGATGFSHVLASTLTQPTVLTAYPHPQGLAQALKVEGTGQVAQHAAGYAVLHTPEPCTFPSVVRTTLLLDQLLSTYRNSIVALSNTIDADTMILLERANQLVLLVPLTGEGLRQLRQLRAQLARYTTTARVGLHVIGVSNDMIAQDQQLYDGVDDVLPLSALTVTDQLPAGHVAHVLNKLIDRFDRTHQIAVYIPTTIAVDQLCDTTPYVERALALLGARFGGATSTAAQGVWQSQEAGLVRESVYLVQTYATEAALNRYLDEIVGFVRMIKQELKQEAMAIEVDQKLMLI